MINSEDAYEVLNYINKYIGVGVKSNVGYDEDRACMEVLKKNLEELSGMDIDDFIIICDKLKKIKYIDIQPYGYPFQDEIYDIKITPTGRKEGLSEKYWENLRKEESKNNKEEKKKNLDKKFKRSSIWKNRIWIFIIIIGWVGQLIAWLLYFGII